MTNDSIHHLENDDMNHFVPSQTHLLNTITNDPTSIHLETQSIENIYSHAFQPNSFHSDSFPSLNNSISPIKNKLLNILEYIQNPQFIIQPFHQSTLYDHSKCENYFKISNRDAWSPDGTCLLAHCPEEGIFKLFELPQSFYDATPLKKYIIDEEESSTIEKENSLINQINQINEQETGIEREEKNIRHWEPSPLNVCLTMNPGVSCYDVKWNPKMNSNDPPSSFFVSSCKGGQLIIWDAFHNNLQRHTLRIENHLGQTMEAYCIQFYHDPEYILCGLNRSISIMSLDQGFIVTSLNAQSISMRDKNSHLFSSMISTIEYNQGPGMHTMFAFGNYHGDIGLIDDRYFNLIDSIPHSQNNQNINNNQNNFGITQLQFSECGNYLFSASRKDTSIHCWDIRMLLEDPLYSVYRDAMTNQKIGFDISQGILYTGSKCGHLYKYDLSRNGQLISKTKVGSKVTVAKNTNYEREEDSNIVVNGVGVHPILPYVALSTGERNYFYEFKSGMEESDSSEEDESITDSNSKTTNITSTFTTNSTNSINSTNSTNSTNTKTISSTFDKNNNLNIFSESHCPKIQIWYDFNLL